MVTLVSYNIQYGKGQDNQIDLDRIAGEVSGADVIALQEVDRYWPHTGMVDQVARLTDRLPDYYWIYGPGVDLHVDTSAPADNRRRQFGNMLLCKSPIQRSRNHLLPKTGSTDALSIQRSAVEATVELGSHLVRLYSVHLCHLAEETRLPQVERLLEIHRTAVFEGASVCGDLEGKDFAAGICHQEVPGNAIMMGDFNCQPGSREYHQIVGPRSDYGGIVSSPAGYFDAWTVTGNDRGKGSTSDVDGVPATLDYCFVSGGLRALVQTCKVDTTATGSDHLPLWIEIDL